MSITKVPAEFNRVAAGKVACTGATMGCLDGGANERFTLAIMTPAGVSSTIQIDVPARTSLDVLISQAVEKAQAA